MRRLLTSFLVLVALLCTACATSVQEPDSAQNGHSLHTLQFQKRTLAPDSDAELIRSDVLREGDILLSSAKSVTSVGVRLITLSPVSHALLYLGDGQVVEAVGSGVRTRTIEDVLTDEAIIVAFRHPAVTPEHGEKMREFAANNLGGRYNHLGIVLQAPFSIERRLCELPLIPDAIRDSCIRGIAAIQLGAGSNDRFFCSQFVLEAFRQSGLPITDADSRLISPADILHMREGDVPAVLIHQPLMYVGHLKYDLRLLKRDGLAGQSVDDRVAQSDR